MSVKQHLIPSPRSAFFMACLAMSMAGCSSLGIDNVLPNHKVDYKNSQSVKSLDVPPDLTMPDYDRTYAVVSGEVVSANRYTQRRPVEAVQNNVLPASTDVKVVNQGGVRYLQVNAPAEVLWPKLKAFWGTLGVAIEKEEPRVGVMETEWAQNRAGLPNDWLRRLVGTVFRDSYDAGTRDKFRLRVERAGTKTHVYVSHQRAEELALNAGGVKWELRPADPELEAVILNRISLHLQGGKAANTPEIQQAASVVNLTEAAGRPALQVSGDFASVWLRTGVMLERSGLAIDGQKKEQGIYRVIYRGQGHEKRSWFSRIFKSQNDVVKVGGVYQVHITNQGNTNLISITDEEGMVVSAVVAEKILQNIKTEFDR
ncbi:MAG: outer membrane protein assembly factor BamC [bacterium]